VISLLISNSCRAIILTKDSLYLHSQYQIGYISLDILCGIIRNSGQEAVTAVINSSELSSAMFRVVQVVDHFHQVLHNDSLAIDWQSLTIKFIIIIFQRNLNLVSISDTNTI